MTPVVAAAPPPEVYNATRSTRDRGVCTACVVVCILICRLLKSVNEEAACVVLSACLKPTAVCLPNGGGCPACSPHHREDEMVDHVLLQLCYWAVQPVGITQGCDCCVIINHVRLIPYLPCRCWTLLPVPALPCLCLFLCWSVPQFDRLPVPICFNTVSQSLCYWSGKNSHLSHQLLVFVLFAPGSTSSMTHTGLLDKKQKQYCISVVRQLYLIWHYP